VQLGPGEARRRARDRRNVHARLERDGLGVEREDGGAALDVGQRHLHDRVEAARPHERAVEDLGEVGRSDHNDAFVLVEAVQLDEELVERHLHGLLVLRVAVRADRVDLVDEDDARRARLGRGEEVAHAPRADAYEDLLKLRAGHVEERHARLARDRAREEGLARAGRAGQHHALGQLAAQPREVLGRAQVLDDLLELGLDLVDADDVRKRLRRRRDGLDVRGEGREGGGAAARDAALLEHLRAQTADGGRTGGWARGGSARGARRGGTQHATRAARPTRSRDRPFKLPLACA
jgi:hypothetical protein